MSDVLITPASKKIEFKDASSNIDGLIKLDTNDNLVISSVNDLVLGDGATDLHVGDGTNSVDLVFDQTGSIYSLGNKHLTIGKSSLNGNDVVIDSPNWSVTDAGVATFGSIQSYPGNMKVGDGVKVVFGDDDDMFIIHDGSNATMQNDTGLLNIDGQTGIYFDVNGSNNFRIMSDHVGSWRDMRMWAQTRVRFYDSDTSNYVALRSPDTVTSDVTWKLPAADGSNGEHLTTDGSGNLSWAASSSFNSEPALFMHTSSHNITTTESTIPFNSQIFDPSNNCTVFTGSNAGHIRINDTGYYLISYSIPINDDGTTIEADRTRVFTKMEKATNSGFTSGKEDVPQSRAQVYTREASGGSGLSATFLYNHTGGQYIRIRIDAQNNTNISTESNQAQISIVKVPT